MNEGAALIHVQTQLESEKGALVRILHDDLGGLLVGAAMDMSWVAQQAQLPNNVGERLARVSALLRSAIELKRTLVEELQPSLLRNVGLFAALRWHIKRTCDAAGVTYVENYPPTETVLAAANAITAFRLVQESVEYLLGDGSVNALSIDVADRGSALHCHLLSERTECPKKPTPAAETLFKTFMHYRAFSIGGQCNLTSTASRQEVDMHIPLSSG